MAAPVRFDIELHGSVWALARDGERLGVFSHLDRATHEAVNLARELAETGEPTQVLVHPADGKVIEVDAGPIAIEGPLPADDGVDRSRA